MRYLLIMLFLLANAFIKAQTTKEIIQSELKEMLVDGKVLFDSVRINNEKKKMESDSWWIIGKTQRTEAKLRLKGNDNLKKSLITNFNYPDNGMKKTPVDSLIFKGKDIIEFGSYIIQDYTTFSKKTYPGTTREPELPITVNSAQFGIPSTLNSNYQLYATLNYLMSLYNEADGGVEASVFSAAAQSSLEKTKTESRTLSVGYGIFRNGLANIFRKTIDEEPFMYSNQFIPLIKVWQLYKDSVINSNSRILGSFEGMIIYKTTKTAELSNTDFSASSNVNISTPFISLNNETNLNWGKSRTSRTEENTFDIYMVEKPNDFQKFPTIDKIMVAWNQFRNDMELPKYVDPVTFLNLSDDKVHEIILTFGPVDEYYGNQVFVDKHYTFEKLKDQRVISDIRKAPGRPIINKETGMMYYKIQITPNKDFISNYSEFQTERFYKSIPIRLYIKDSLQYNTENYSLDRYYQVESRIETYPLPFLVDEPRYIISNNKYEATIPLVILTKESVSSIIIDTIEFQKGSYSELSNSFLKSLTIEKTGNNFILNISSNLDSTIFNLNSKFNASVEMSVVTKDRVYPREINIRLPYQHVDKDGKQGLPKIVEIPTYIELEEVLDMNSEVEKGITLKEFRSNFLIENKLDTISFNSALIDKLDIKGSTFKSSYLIDSSFIDIKKLIHEINKPIKE